MRGVYPEDVEFLEDMTLVWIDGEVLYYVDEYGTAYDATIKDVWPLHIYAPTAAVAVEELVDEAIRTYVL